MIFMKESTKFVTSHHISNRFSQQTSAIAHLQGLCCGRRRGRHAERPHVGRHRGDGGNQHGVQDSEGGVG